MTRGDSSFLQRALLQRRPSSSSSSLHLLRTSYPSLVFLLPILSSSICQNHDLATTMSNPTESRTLFDELKSLEKGFLFDFGHPLLNRVAESFLKAAGIGAVQAVTREVCVTAVEGTGTDSGVPDLTANKKHRRFPDLRGENCKKSLEAMVKNTGKESFQWGFAAGMYSGLTYGLSEARGSHDWKNSALAGAVTGAALALTVEDASQEEIVQCAITGAALATAANLLSGIF